MVSQKVRIRRQSKKLQVQGAQFLRNEAYLEYAAMIHPVKSREARRQSRFNRAGDAARHRNWTFYEAVKIHSRHTGHGGGTKKQEEGK